MKSSRPIVALIMCYALALGLAGCQGGTTTTEAQTTTSLQTETTAATATTAQPPTTTAGAALQGGVPDPTGDVQSMDEGTAEGAFASLGDIESVRLEAQSEALVVEIRTVDDLPVALPTAIESLTFALEIWVDADAGYLLSLSQMADLPRGWFASVTDSESGVTVILESAPALEGDTLRCAFPLSDMPGLAPSFKWRLDCQWAEGTNVFSDSVPETGDDPLSPALLDFPY